MSCVHVSVHPYMTLFKRTSKMSSSSILKSPGGVLGQASKQAGRQTERKAGLQASKQASQPARKQASRWGSRQASRQASTHASRQIILRYSGSTIALRRRAGFGRWNIICTQAPTHWQVLMETERTANLHS